MLAQLTRTAVYGPVCTVVWQGSAGDRGPYADQISISLSDPKASLYLGTLRNAFTANTSLV